MAKKKVLIITYYWPPGGGSGVQRWLKFAKYLPEFGWEPVIYTPSNPEHPVEDKSLIKDVPEGITVIKQPIKEPYSLYKIFSGKKNSEKIQTGFLNESSSKSIFENIFRWIRGNMFIPDARKNWIKPSVKFLSKWLEGNPVDIIVSTGPPHSMHLIALGLKKIHNIIWLADFRDPWTQIDFYHHLMLTKKADKKHKYLEKEVLKNADHVTTVSNNCATGLEKISGKKTEVITNGYDPDDFLNCADFSYNHFSITHLGSMNKDRNPSALWQALNEASEDIPEIKKRLKIKLIGKTDYAVFKDIEKHGLTKYLEQVKYLPHDEALNFASNSAILLLALNNTPNIKSIITGKVFEYLALKRPILCIGHKSGDAAELLEKTISGTSFNPDEVDDIKTYLEKQFDNFQQKSLYVKSENIEQYSRPELTKKLVGLFNTSSKT